MRKTWIVALLAAGALSARDRIAVIEFFGYRGIDVDAVRRALPFHEGDPQPKNPRAAVEKAVRQAIGRDATDVGGVCCIGDADFAVFIGVAGESSRPFAYDAAPPGEAPPSAELLRLGGELDRTEEAAVRAGRGGQEGRPGYRLMKDPAARRAELAFRAYALQHEDELYRTLDQDRRAENRARAADALGYCAATPRLIAALVRASRDSSDHVRNNATRALGEIVSANAAIGAQIPPDAFIAMVRSGIWSDRNKASFLLLALTQSRDRGLLDRLRDEAADALDEMARWRPSGWAFPARVILGRIHGIEEQKLMELASGTAEAFFAALPH